MRKLPVLVTAVLLLAGVLSGLSYLFSPAPLVLPLTSTLTIPLTSSLTYSSTSSSASTLTSTNSGSTFQSVSTSTQYTIGNIYSGGVFPPPMTTYYCAFAIAGICFVAAATYTISLFGNWTSTTTYMTTSMTTPMTTSMTMTTSLLTTTSSSTTNVAPFAMNDTNRFVGFVLMGVLLASIVLLLLVRFKPTSEHKPKQATLTQFVKSPTCAKCGAELPLKSKFCNNCGTKQP